MNEEKMADRWLYMCNRQLRMSINNHIHINDRLHYQSGYLLVLPIYYRMLT